ncbi:amidohydrolase [Frankia sp. Cr1]|uniref:amidohydrolase n=1 Tax=Frankia sp. Cr1 TaxID=3073931 RepID=UPI003A0FFD13
MLRSAVELYLDLHQTPELSGSEERTAARIRDWLRDAGFEVFEGVGGHGVVAVLRNGPGPVVMLRTEMDALPVEENTGLPYASTAVALDENGHRQAVMHACGHDVHIACVLLAAGALASRRELWQGTLLILGQPAEETLTGAAAMLADGLYRRWPRPDVVLAQHVGPFPAGMIMHSTGLLHAAGAALDIVIHGRSGHAGMPDLATNPIPIAADLVRLLCDEDVTPTDDGLAVLRTVGAIHAGSSANVIPPSATVRLALRSLSEDAISRAITSVQNAVTQLAERAGCTVAPEVSVVSRSQVNFNDPRMAERVFRTHRTVFGASLLAVCPPSMATEDFPLLATDHDAVVAGLALPYSNGPTEGVITKVKLIKRQMYGRAGFPLLRQRILLS